MTIMKESILWYITYIENRVNCLYYKSNNEVKLVTLDIFCSIVHIDRSNNNENIKITF